jgi:hypothetical protein
MFSGMILYCHQVDLKLTKIPAAEMQVILGVSEFYGAQFRLNISPDITHVVTYSDQDVYFNVI